MSVNFMDESVAVLSRTPAVLDALLRDLPEVWTSATEGPDTWSPYTVIGHLIHCELVDWMPRLDIILEHGEKRPFDPFDREAQFREGTERPLNSMLDDFRRLRHNNVTRLLALNLQPEQLKARGSHPALGAVTARHLLATWTAHDLSHIVQISRVMAKRYAHEVGPWKEYLSVLK